MQITVHVQIEDDDTFDSTPEEVANAVLEAIGGNPENDRINVAIQPMSSSISIGGSVLPPPPPPEE